MPETTGHTLGALATVCGGVLEDPAAQAGVLVRSVATIEEAGPDTITWITERKYVKALAACRAAAIIGSGALLADHPRGMVVADTELAVAKVLERFAVPYARPDRGVHPSAVVHETAQLGPGVAIGALVLVGAEARIGENSVIHGGVSIGKGVRIGRDCELHARCVIYDRCEIGDRVTVHGGAVIGADGFGYLFRDGKHRKYVHLGTVVIEDDVEIGANTCIDRGKLAATRIGRGSKIDNLVQLAHNVELGPSCIVIAQCGLSGSVRMGRGAVMAGQAGVVHGVRIGDGARVGAKGVVWSDVPAGQTVLGAPAQLSTKELRERARVRKLPMLFEQIKDLTRRVAELEAAADSGEGR